MTEVDDKFLLELQKCMREASIFFERQDQMNARLHLSDINPTPLAQLVEENYRKLNIVINRNRLLRKHDSN